MYILCYQILKKEILWRLFFRRARCWNGRIKTRWGEMGAYPGVWLEEKQEKWMFWIRFDNREDGLADRVDVEGDSWLEKLERWRYLLLGWVKPEENWFGEGWWSQEFFFFFCHVISEASKWRHPAGHWMCKPKDLNFMTKTNVEICFGFHPLAGAIGACRLDEI